MDGFLNYNQIHYVLYHLGMEIEMAEQLTQFFVFSKESQWNEQGKIIFQLSSKPFNIDEVVKINDIPVLFPLSKSIAPFYTDESGNLVFSHDFLKSAFFLLSGWQEHHNTQSKDNLGRFAYTDSVQAKLHCNHKPIVHYYFQFLIDGIELFCQKNKVPFKRKRLFNSFGFLLSHDIDVVKQFDRNYIGYKIKELLGLRQSALPKNKILQLISQALQGYVGIKKNDPYWNFQFLRDIEKQFNLRSTFYFLDQGVKYADARYSFTEPRIRELFSFLKNENCEIGIHGSVKSGTNKEVMFKSIQKLQDESNVAVVGNRQHRLLWDVKKTPHYLQECGIKYDTTLGFAACEGFRNSYCYPFKLYDVENDRMTDLWEFPLQVMDVTLYAYQRYDFKMAFEKCTDIIHEVEKFGGIFTLLWHNSSFDEVSYPGVTDFYKRLLGYVVERNAQNMLGSELLAELNK